MATIILIVVCFNVPYFKTVYFLRATYNSNGQGGYISLGTLGYCLNVNGDETCTKPSIGYEFSKSRVLVELRIKCLTLFFLSRRPEHTFRK